MKTYLPQWLVSVFISYNPICLKRLPDAVLSENAFTNIVFKTKIMTNGIVFTQLRTAVFKTV